MTAGDLSSFDFLLGAFKHIFLEQLLTKPLEAMMMQTDKFPPKIHAPLPRAALCLDGAGCQGT